MENKLLEQQVIHDFNKYLPLIQQQFRDSGIVDPILDDILLLDTVNDLDGVKNIHYARQKLNVIPNLDPEDIRTNGDFRFVPDHQDDLHESGFILNPSREKWVSLDGRIEVILEKIPTGYDVVTTDQHVGTYNFAPQDAWYFSIESILHFKLDVNPWILLGNTEGDNAQSVAEREGLFFGKLQEIMWINNFSASLGENSILSQSPLIKIAFYLHIRDGLIQENEHIKRLIDSEYQVHSEEFDALARDIFGADIREVASWHASTRTWFGAEVGGWWDPLVIDLDGDGVAADLTGSNRLYFDLDGDGLAEAVSWVRPDDGLLVHDANADGRIAADELFGDAVTHGFAELAMHDGDGDGIVDSGDAIWTSLQVWRDLNQDGVSQADELFSLGDLGITGFDVVGFVQNGNGRGLISHLGSATTADGVIEVGNVNFEIDQNNSRYDAEYDLDLRTLFLPTLRGFNDLPELHVALSLDNDETDPASLMSLMLDVGARDMTSLFADWPGVRATLEAALYRWAGVDDIDPASRGAFLDDARKLAFIEAFFGEAFFDRNEWGSNPGLVQARGILELWNGEILQNVIGGMLVQTAAARIFEAGTIEYDFTAAQPVGAQTLSADALDELATAAAALPDATAKLAFWAAVADFLFIVHGGVSGDYGLNSAEEAQLEAALQASGATFDWAAVAYAQQNPAGETIHGMDGADDHTLDAAYAGGFQADVIIGLGGADHLAGQDGADVLYGHSADGLGDDGAADMLRGGQGEDVLHGGDGDDILYGDADGDHLIGGAGDDHLHAGTDGGQNLLDGGLGDDHYYISGNRNAQTTEPIDYIQDSGGHDTLHLPFGGGLGGETLQISRVGDTGLKLDYSFHNLGGTNSYQVIIADQLADETFGGAIETVAFDNGHTESLIDFLNAYDDAFFTQGNDNAEIINGVRIGNRQDTIHAEGGADLVRGDDGDDHIRGGSGGDELHGGAGDDVLKGDGGDDIAYGGDGDDKIIAETAHGGAGADEVSGVTIFGDDGDDVLDGTFVQGGAGDDLIRSRSADGVLDGGDGDDRIEDFGGSDLYRLSAGDDVIRDRSQGDADIDVLVFRPGVTFEALDLRRVGEGGAHLQITRSDGSTVLIEDQFAAPLPGYRFGVETLRFDAGDVSVADLDVPFYLTEDDDTFDADDRNAETRDVVHGRGGRDTIRGDNLADQLFGDAGDDNLFGERGDDVLDGGAGQDNLFGGYGDDVYHYSGGRDRIYDGNGVPNYSNGPSGAGDDAIRFGPGVSQADISLIHTGAGHLRIDVAGQDSLLVYGQLNAVQHEARYAVEQLIFDDGTTLGLVGVDKHYDTHGTEDGDTLYDIRNTSKIKTASDDNVVYGHGGDDVITAGEGADTLFGGEGDDVLTGGFGRDILDGGAGDDILDGGSPNFQTSSGDADFYRVSQGNDRIITSDPGQHILEFGPGVTLADLLVYKDPFVEAGVVIEHADGSVRIDHFTEYRGITKLRFTDGETKTTVRADDVDYESRDAIGTAGDDTLFGNDGWSGSDDTYFAAGAGDDVVVDTDGGDDIFSYTSGQDRLTDTAGYDRILLDAAYSVFDVAFIDDGRDLVLRLGAGGDELRIVDFHRSHYFQVEALEFASGMTLGALGAHEAYIRGTDASDALVGDVNRTQDYLFAGAGDDVVNGGLDDDVIDGGLGDDRLSGGAGDDAIWDPSGDDVYVYARGDGADTLHDQGGAADAIHLIGYSIADIQIADIGAANLEISFADGPDDRILIAGHRSGGGAQAIETLVFADGTRLILGEKSRFDGAGTDDLMKATGDDDRVYGWDGNDVLIGYQGDDELYGGLGADRLDGRDGDDVMVGGAGDDIYVVDSAGDTVIETADGGLDRVNVYADYTMPMHVEYLVGKFAAVGLQLIGNAGRNQITGANKVQSPDEIYGEDGNDRLVGLVGDDTIEGGAGRDRIFGNSGQDQINGGAGHDVLTGNQHADWFVFDLGSGVDTITDFTVGVDRIDLTAYGFASFGAVMALTADIAGRTQINLDGNNAVIRLNGVATADLTEEDFIL